MGKPGRRRSQRTEDAASGRLVRGTDGAALGTVRAADAWVVRIDPVRQVVVIAGIAVATALRGAAELRAN